MSYGQVIIIIKVAIYHTPQYIDIELLLESQKCGTKFWYISIKIMQLTSIISTLPTPEFHSTKFNFVSRQKICNSWQGHPNNFKTPLHEGIAPKHIIKKRYQPLLYINHKIKLYSRSFSRRKFTKERPNTVHSQRQPAACCLYLWTIYTRNLNRYTYAFYNSFWAWESYSLL